MNLHEYLKSHNEANSALLLDEEKLHAIVAAIALCIEKAEPSGPQGTVEVPLRQAISHAT
jgi:hypothetical protein